jgi:DDE family transposase
VYALRRGGGLSARERSGTDRTKYPSSRRRRRRIDWARYRHFLRHGWRDLFAHLRRIVNRLPPPYPVRPPGTPDRPPTDPRSVVRFLLLRALEGWSYDETHASLAALPDLRRQLGFRRLPAAPTVAALSVRVPPTYFEQLIGELARSTATEPTNLAGDGTGLTTRRFERWMDAKGRGGLRHIFVKLHALVSTRAQFPLFFAARVSDGLTADVVELPGLLRQVPSEVRLGNVVLDQGYIGKRIAQAVADRGGRPVIDLRANITANTTADGSPAWKSMVRGWFQDRREFRCRYRRRPVIEGVFGAFKDRFGARIRSRRPEAQRAEILARVAVWNLVAVSYHQGRT